MKNNHFTVRLSARPLYHLSILLILSSCILSSCTITKQLHQDKTKITSETSAHETTVSNNQIISSTRVTESQDTSVLFKGSELFSSANFNSLLSGDTIHASEANLQLKTFYDSLTRTIKTHVAVKSQTVSFKYQKITEKIELQTNNATSIKQKHNKQIVHSVNKEKEITSYSLLKLFIIIVIVSGFVFIVFVVLKFKRFL